MGKKSPVPRADFDGAWKLTLDRYLDRFLQLCFPTVHAGIDWSQKYAALDQELQEVVRDAQRGYSKENVLELFRLIDWLLRLPEEQRIEFRRELIEYEASKHMPYITSIEEMGRQEGRQEGRREGRQEGLREGILAALEIRFGPAPDSIRQTLEATQDEAKLRSLHRIAIQTASLAAFARELEG